jgi:hypothetical protein
MRDQPVTDLDAVREELRRLQNLCLDQAAALRARDERIHHLEEHTNAPLAVAYAAAPAAVSRGKQRAHAPLARVSAAAAAAVDAASEESPRNSSEAPATPFPHQRHLHQQREHPPFPFSARPRLPLEIT